MRHAWTTTKDNETMRQFTLILFLTLSTITCFGQSLFFDNLKSSTWTSEKFYNDSTIKMAKEISLIKSATSKDKLKTNKTIWTFNDVLNISYYNVTTSKDTLITTHK